MMNRISRRTHVALTIFAFGSLALGVSACGGRDLRVDGDTAGLQLDDTVGASPDAVGSDGAQQLVPSVPEEAAGAPGVLPGEPSVPGVEVDPLHGDGGAPGIGPVYGGAPGIVDPVGTGPDEEPPRPLAKKSDCTAIGDAQLLTVPTDYESIQDAINDAQYGDIVFVEAGEYHEHVQLRSGVSLVGAGAHLTVLDGDGEGGNLIDFTDASNTRVLGFTLRNVGRWHSCQADVFGCSGNWYSSAVYADGHSYDDNADACDDASIELSQNVIADNDIGVMFYFNPVGRIHNNVFVGNGTGFVANHHGDGTGTISHNVFYGNKVRAVGLSASFIDVLDNVFVENGTAVEQEYIQQGLIQCNVFDRNEAIGDSSRMGVNAVGDVTFHSEPDGDFRLASIPELPLECVNADEPGAFTGSTGNWYGVERKREDLLSMLGR